MPRIRIEITGDDGSRDVAEFDGEKGFKKAIRFIELSEESFDEIEYVSTPQSRIRPEQEFYNGGGTYSQEELTLKERLYLFLKYELSQTWFTSHEVRAAYSNVYGPINLSTVSTYLARLSSEGVLEKRGNRVKRAYRIVEELPPSHQRAQHALD